MKNIVLIGFMGTGKTSTGRLLASLTGRPFIDVDKKIEIDSGMVISEMFATLGEAYFRNKEHQAIAEISAGSGCIIATGGGAVLSTANMKLLRSNGIIISLTASPDTIMERTERVNTRPLLNQPDRKEAISKLLAERKELYKDADLCLDTDALSPQQTVEKIVAFLRQEGYIVD